MRGLNFGQVARLFLLLLFPIYSGGAESWAAQSQSVHTALQGNVEAANGPNVGLVETTQPAAATNGNVPFPPDIQRIMSRGKLVVAMFHLDRPPFFYINEQGQLAGMDVEMAADIAHRLGVKLEFNRDSSSFDAVVDQVVNGQADMAISKVSITMSRALRVAFTDPYLVFHHTLLINRLQLAALLAKNPAKSALELLGGASNKIGVRSGTAWVGYAQQAFPKAQVVVAESMEGLVASAIHGEVLALMYDEFEIKKIMDNQPELNIDLQMLMLPNRLDPIGIAVGTESRHLLAWLNQYLKYGNGASQFNDLSLEYNANRTLQAQTREQR